MSKRITRCVHLRLLGIKGLRQDEQVINCHLMDHPTDIQGAAFKVLKYWYMRQPDWVWAYNDLHVAVQYVDKLMQG